MSSQLQPGPRFNPDIEMNIKQSLFDVDDTLVEPHTQELPTNRFLLAAHAAGEYSLVGLVSARSLPKAEHIIDAAQMRGLSILNNGAQIHDGESGLMIVERAMPVKATVDILKTLQSQDIGHSIQDDGIDYWWQTVDGKGNYFKKKNLDEPFLANNQLVVPAFRPEKPFFIAVHKLTPDEIDEMRDVGGQYQGQHLAVNVVHEYLKEDGSKTFDIFFADDRADKQKALEVVSELSDMELANIMVTGDGLNDAGMVSTAGVGVAMGNAAEKTKKNATFIAPNRFEDGAAVALEELVLAKHK